MDGFTFRVPASADALLADSSDWKDELELRREDDVDVKGACTAYKLHHRVTP